MPVGKEKIQFTLVITKPSLLTDMETLRKLENRPSRNNFCENAIDTYCEQEFKRRGLTRAPEE